jgi:hypothetical protein
MIWQSISVAREATRIAVAVLGVIVWALACAGCGNSDAPVAPDVTTSHLALSLPSGLTISSVDYRVLSSAQTTLAAGTIEVSSPGATVSLDLVLAPAIGDVVDLSAETSAGLSCAGASAPFDVAAGRATLVNLTLVCGGDLSP